MRRVSKKRASQMNKYRRIAKAFKEANPYCQAKIEGCTVMTIDIHHMQGRGNERLLDVDNFLPVCRNCHNKIGTMPIDEQIELGLSKSKHRV